MHKAIPNAFENGQRMANVRLIPARLRPLAVLLWLLIPQVYAQPANSSFELDDSRLVGRAKEQKNITRFNQANAIEPGTYQVDIVINGNFLSRQSLVFAAGEQGVVAACLGRENMVD
ncbi:FimD/PapC N-terminal domain-containing protein, partial [Serratia sp. Ag1]|uniref:FimD/PapC N-terminal domain-containing protein n=1 Tax=Serratia sp. Ag1 TaxID=1524467 RepID=UPI000562DEAC